MSLVANNKHVEQKNKRNKLHVLTLCCQQACFCAVTKLAVWPGVADVDVCSLEAGGQRCMAHTTYKTLQVVQEAETCDGHGSLCTKRCDTTGAELVVVGGRLHRLGNMHGGGTHG